jgi:hypothetical protein
MAEFKGTQGDWEYEVDLDYDQGGNSIGLGPVVEANGEVILKGITRDGTIEGCNFKDVRIAAAAPAMFALLNDLNNWLVCSCIATPEDMAQSFEAYQQEIEALLNKALGV